jgi:hypothetical protein
MWSETCRRHSSTGRDAVSGTSVQAQAVSRNWSRPPLGRSLGERSERFRMQALTRVAAARREGEPEGSPHWSPFGVAFTCLMRLFSVHRTARPATAKRIGTTRTRLPQQTAPQPRVRFHIRQGRTDRSRPRATCVVARERVRDRAALPARSTASRSSDAGRHAEAIARRSVATTAADASHPSAWILIWILIWTLIAPVSYVSCVSSRYCANAAETHETIHPGIRYAVPISHFRPDTSLDRVVRLHRPRWGALIGALTPGGAPLRRPGLNRNGGSIRRTSLNRCTGARAIPCR